jgi:hypothetical protein
MGQPAVFTLDGCSGFQRKVFTYGGYASTPLPPAPKFGLVLGAADFPCSSQPVDSIIEASTNTAVKGCRVEMPVFSKRDNATRPCAASTFRFVDEFFAAAGSARSVDLSALSEGASVRNETYYFAGPLCVDKVHLADLQLQDLNRWQSGGGSRGMLDEDEAMLLQPPMPEDDGPEPYGSTCFGKQSLGVYFKIHPGWGVLEDETPSSSI